MIDSNISNMKWMILKTITTLIKKLKEQLKKYINLEWNKKYFENNKEEILFRNKSKLFMISKKKITQLYF